MEQTRIAPQDYLDFLRAQGCNFFAGVPDSLLKTFCACAQGQLPKQSFWIAANEGAAVGMAIGSYLAGGKVPVVYLQNSGLGNTLNPLVSMADPLVYGIPLLLLIGWRGELGQAMEETGEQLADEPQHRLQGRITLPQLAACNIPYEILPDEEQAARNSTARLLQRAKQERRPVALVVRKGTFSGYAGGGLAANNLPVAPSLPQPLLLGREEVIGLLLGKLTEGPIVATTGMISRELFEQRAQRGETHERDFLVVGAMGHASAIAQGIAQEMSKGLALRHKSNPPVYCLDGDGALLMHLGSMAVIGQAGGQANLKHIVLNNGAHDSVGGQPTVALALDIPAMAKASGYRWAEVAKTRAELKQQLAQFTQAPSPALLEIQLQKGARANLGRPTCEPQQLKAAFMAYVAGLQRE